MSSRVNILVSFKIYSHTDTYYLVGSSNTGSFTHKLGKGWNTDGSPDLYHSRISEAELSNLENNGLSVSKVVPLGEKYGDYRMRMYAENELGIRSPYVELDKVIPAPDIDGTFRFNSLYVDRLIAKKPSAYSVVKKSPRRAAPNLELDNSLEVESEFIGRSALVKWDLKAPYGFTGSPKGTVVNASNVDLFESLFSHFEIYFYKEPPQEKISTAADVQNPPAGSAVFDSDLPISEEGQIVDLSYDKRVGESVIIDEDNFSIGFSKELIEDLIGEEERFIYVKVIGKDIFYNSAIDKYKHRFTGTIKVENIRSQLEESYADLYGNQMTLSYINRDQDFQGGKVVLRSFTSSDPSGPWVNDDSAVLNSAGGSNVFKQKWSSPTNRNYYKYVLEVHDSYGFCGYHSLSSKGVLDTFFTVKLLEDSTGYDNKDAALTAAINDTYSWQSERKIGSVSIKESGSDFNITWNIVDSQGHLITPPAPSKDASGVPIFTMGDRVEIEDLAGFTVNFECPDEYVNTGNSFPVRDAFDLEVLGIESEDSSGNVVYKYGAPDDSSGQLVIPETIGITDGVLTAENKLSINLDTTLQLTKEQNADLYRSWFNDINFNDVPTDSEFRVLYKENNDLNVGSYKDKGFYAVDAQRRIKISVSLIDSEGRIVDTKLAEGYNAPPRILVNQGLSSNASQVSSASVKATDLVEFKLSLNEKANSVAIFRRPVEEYNKNEDKFYGVGGEANVDKTRVDDPDHATPAHVYNFKDSDFFAGSNITSQDIMFYGFGVEMDRWHKDDDPEDYITNAEYDALPEDAEAMVAAGATQHKKQFVRYEVTGKNINDVGEGGFFTTFVDSKGNKPNSDAIGTKNFLAGGRVIGAENMITIVDQPPLIREQGLTRRKAPGTQYDYMLVPFDSFGTGQAWLPQRINFYGGILFSQDENGAIGTLDFDAPFPPENLVITGANKTFFLEWDAPSFQSGDIDYYNLYYIKDSRSETQRLGLGGSDTRIADGDILRFNKDDYDHENSEFHAMDLDFDADNNGTYGSVLAWSPQAYNKNHYVKRRPRGDSTKAFRLYKANANTSASDEPGKSDLWEEQINVQLWENGTAVHRDDVKFNERDENPLADGSGGSQTFNLIYYNSFKSYGRKNVVFRDHKCYICNTPTSGSFNPSHWTLIDGVSIEEIKIPTTETSLTVVADTNDKAYFFFESVDRIQNRSKLHVDPTKPESPGVDYAHQLGKSSLKDIDNFEQELSAEFPNAIMLRPSDPFEIENSTNKDGAKIKWKSHYLYNDGYGYFMPAGEMSLRSDTTYIKDKTVDANQFIRHIYWNPQYGYNTNAITDPWTPRIEDNMTVRENQLPYRKKSGQESEAPDRISADTFSDLQSQTQWVARADSDVLERVVTANPNDNSNYYEWNDSMYEAVPTSELDVDSSLAEKESDTEIQYRAYYSFSTGNPASQIYNRRDDQNWLSDPVIDQVSSSSNDNIWDKLNSHNTVIHDTPEPVGFGKFGIHIPRKETLKTNVSPAGNATNGLLRDGGFQICRIDYIDGEYSHKVNFEVFNNATIGQANISNATITSAQITDLSADRITAGTIGSHKIEIGNALIPKITNGVLGDAQLDSTNGAPGIIDQDGNVTAENTSSRAFTNSEYAYGAITSQGFGHETKGKPGFFISGDGQFAFQTTNGGIYLRGGLDTDRNQDNHPTQLVVRGTLIQENSDPFVKMEMSASTQNLTFNEHAENHFYYLDNNEYKIYGAEAQVLRPSNGEVTISYSIQNAYHTDGSPYDINELQLIMYVDGDPSRTVAHKDVMKLIKSSLLPGYSTKWVSQSLWDSVDYDSTRLNYDQLFDSDPGGGDYVSISVLESTVHGQCMIGSSANSSYKNKTACEDAGGTWIPVVSDTGPAFGLNDIDDLNKGGSITFDFVGGRYADLYESAANIDISSTPEMIHFTGVAITGTEATEAKERISEEDFNDVGENPGNTLIPIADSITIVLRMISRAPNWDSTQTYLFGELVRYNSKVWRSVNNTPDVYNRGETPSASSTFWDEEPTGEVIVEEKSVTIFRKDQPTNLASIDLVITGDNVIRNSDGSKVTVHPVLTYGATQYSLESINGLEDWMKTIRSQMAIYQGPPNELKQDKYKLLTSGKENFPSGNTSFSVTLENKDVIKGKTTLYLVDTTDNSNWPDSRDSLDVYKEIATIDIVDINDGVDVGYIDLQKKDKFYTREYLIRPTSSNVVDYSSSYKLEPITNKEFNATIRINHGGRELSKEIIIKIPNVALGNYIEKKDIIIQDKDSGNTICSFASNGGNPTMVPFTLEGDNEVEKQQEYNTITGNSADDLKKTGVGRVYFSVDDINHVTEIVVRFDFIKTRGNTVAVVDSNNTTSSTHYKPDPLSSSKTWGTFADQNFTFANDMVEQISAEENILINTLIRPNPSFRLSLTKPYISYSRNTLNDNNQVSNQALLRRSENIVPIQLFMGEDNITDEVDNKPSGAEFDMEIIPTFGFVVSYKFLSGTGTNTGKCWPVGRKSDARNAINDLKVEQIEEGVYFNGSKWRQSDPISGEDIDADSNFLYYIPPRLSDLSGMGNSKIKIKATYERTNVPVASSQLRGTNSGGFTTDSFSDIETINVIETLNGESAPFVVQDNESVSIEVSIRGEIIKAIAGADFDSKIRVQVADDKVALLGSNDVLLDDFVLTGDNDKIRFEAASSVSISNNTNLTFKNNGGSSVNLYGFDGSQIKIKTKTGSAASVKRISMFDEIDSSQKGMLPAGHTLAFFNSANEIVASCEMPKIFKHGIAVLVDNTLNPPASIVGTTRTYFKTTEVYHKEESGNENDTYIVSNYLFGVNLESGLEIGDTIMYPDGEPWFGTDAVNSSIDMTGVINFYATSRRWRTDEVITTGLSRHIIAAMQGETGAVIVYRAGKWKPGTQFIGTPRRREVVKHGSKYYITMENASELAYGKLGNGDLSFDALHLGENDSNDSTVISSWKLATGEADAATATLERLKPTFQGSTEYNVPPVWEEFGVQVESVATNLLLAHDVRIQRGIVAGLDDATEAFFASQIDISHLDANGNYNYNYNPRPNEKKVTIGNLDNLLYNGAFSERQFINSNGVTLTLSEYQALDAEDKADFPTLDIEGAEHANAPEVPYLLGDTSYDSGHPFNPTLTTTWKVPFTDVPGFFIGYHRLAYDLTTDVSKDYSGFSQEIKSTFDSHLPMMEFRSHTGNFLRWDGLRLEMYGSVINGSVNPNNIQVTLGLGDAINVFSDASLYSGQIFCGGGFNNYIPDRPQSLGSAIVGGGGNRVYGKFSSIAGGYGNSIHGSFSFIGSGYGNSISTNDTALIGYSSVYADSVSVDMSTKIQDMGATPAKNLINGFFEEIFGAGEATTDETNTIYNIAKDAGYTAAETYGKIITDGKDSSGNDYLASGQRPKVDVGFGSMQDRGEKVKGKNISNSFNAIVTGKGNNLIDSKYCIIGSGFGNIIDNNSYSSILNGQGNAIFSRDQGSRRDLTVGNGAGIWQTNSNIDSAQFGQGKQGIITGPSRTDETMWQGLSVLNNLEQKQDHENWWVAKGVSVNTSLSDPKYLPEDQINVSSLMIYESSNQGWFYFTSERLFEEWVLNDKPNTNFGRWVFINDTSGPFVWAGTPNWSESGWYMLKTGPNDVLLFASLKDIVDGVIGNGGEEMFEASWVVFTEDGFQYESINTVPTSHKPGKPADLELLNFADLSLYPDVSANATHGRFGYNTIAGGGRNIINRCSNSSIMGSSNTFISDLKNAVIGGMSNRAYGSSTLNGSDTLRTSANLQKGITIFGSENLFDVRDVNWAYDNLMTSIMGSQNTLIGCRKSVVIGTGNQLKGANKPYFTSGDLNTSSTPPYYNISGTEVNILGTNNIIKGGGLFARNLSIFGSNFVLTSQEQIVNSYYIGNPFPAGGLLTRLFVAADGGAYFTGDVVSFALSDAKYKDNVQVIAEPIEKIKSIRGVTFEWNDNQEVYEGKDIGVIAQEIEKVLPEIVETRKTGKAVKYEKITPLLIEAIKSQQDQIEQLKSSIEDLKSTINKLK